MAFDGDDDFSGSDSDDGLHEDMEALRKACLFAGKDADDLQPSSSTGDVAGVHVAGDDDVTHSVSEASDNDDEDDIELVRSIQERFALSTELLEPISLKPLCSILPSDTEGDVDDFETLRAIQRRFAAYDDESGNGRKESPSDKFEQMEPHRFMKDAVMMLLGLKIALRGMILVLKTQLCRLVLLASQNQHMHFLMP